MAKYKSQLLEAFYPRVESFFRDKEKLRAVEFYISKYIDSNSNVLNYIAPTKRLQFSKEGRDAEIIFDNLDIDPKEISTIVKKIPSIKVVAGVLKEPIFIALALMLRYTNEHDMKKERDLILLYLTLGFYSSLQYRSFNFEPNENIVQFTMNRISNKFYFKQYGTVFKSLYVIADKLNDTSANKLLKDNDKDIIDYLMFLRSRISNTLVTFSQELYKDINSGNYINTAGDDYSEENFREVTNISGFISNATTKSSLNFFQSRLDQRLISMSSRLSDVSNSVLSMTMTSIKDAEREKVERLIRDVVSVYLSDNTNSIDSIGSQKFINYSIAIYTKSNTKDKTIVDLKNILAEFLTDHCEKYNITEREATKNNYRKAVLIYFVLLIAKNT